MLNKRILAASFAGLLLTTGAIYPELESLSASPSSSRWQPEMVGITSPFTGCQNNSGCQLFPARHPALYLEPLSSNALTLGLDDAFDITLAAKDIHLHAISEDKQSVTIQAEKLGHSRTVVGFDALEKPLTELRVHIELSTALEDGQPYLLKFSGTPLQNIAFTYKADAITRTIQVNQVGYLPISRKIAFVGNWLGSAGPLAVTAEHFDVIDENTGKVLFSKELKLISHSDPWSGNAVYHADFSPLQTAGQYHLFIKGIGRSDSFKISPDVYRDVYRKTFRLFFHSRNSIAVTEPYADPGFERSAGIPQSLSGLIHPSILNSPFAGDETAESFRSISGGWFDAGDYGQYIVNAAPVWHAFAAGIDLRSDNFVSDDMGIIESGNGVPDVIDELEWGMNWLLAMQDKKDGGVYSRLVPLKWDSQLPHEVSNPRYLFEKTTHATASFAAAAAIHARLLMQEHPHRAKQVLAAAESAWSFLVERQPWPAEGDRYRNPPGVHAGEYPDKSSLDNRMWAAAELYRTTGKDNYLAAFTAFQKQIEVDPTALVSFKEQALAAYWAMSMAANSGLHVNAELLNQLREKLISSADWLLRKSQEHPYLAPVHQHIGFTGWGSFAHSTRAVIPLLQAHALSGNIDYKDRAADMTNPQLGANPQSISYITGIGQRYPKHPLSKLSKYDKQKEPLAGIPVNGPHYHLPALWPSTQQVNAAYLPAEQAVSGKLDEIDFAAAYPVLRRYVDAFPLPPMSEPTIAEYARTAVAFALLLPTDD